MKTIGLFFGGPSNEHEVSIKSAKNIVKNFDYKKFNLVLVYWDKKGVFYLLKDINKLSAAKKNIKLEDFKRNFDIALLMTHGKYGEDGVLQSLLESQKIKYCGCRALSSALCMDKGLFKQYLSGQGINQVKFLILDYNLETAIGIEEKINTIKVNFKFPLYIKPANSGSSVGVNKINNLSEIKSAIKDALKHDSKIIIEEGLISPKEIEVAVLGNKELNISQPGELKLAKDFYNYDDKYKLGEAKVVIPAEIPDKQKKDIFVLAEKIYKLCACSGFARIDFFVANNKVYLNEINTLPGFTDASMYPILMMNNDLSYKKLINKIIELAY
ncbi:MAG: D-alanine--D-alanine ligase family protein [Candidatus Falkowbacteria bacterium]